MEKKLKRPFRLIKQKNTAKVIEIDEMWHYVGKKIKIVDLDCFCQRSRGLLPKGLPGTFGKTSSFGCQGYSKAALGHL